MPFTLDADWVYPMELTRFRGHLNVRYGGVHDGREEYPVRAGV
jgi:hypothetical protein